MVKKVMKNFHAGKWAFLLGVLLAVIFASLGTMRPEVVSVLVVIGIVVGLLNVNSEEVRAFLLSGIALIIASAFGQNSIGVFPVLERMLDALLVIFVPATIVVAIKNVFVIATNVR
ncbi:MAG: hypothetical protein KKF50_03435 [Nanoarchaeota archaeon]|nr:hypothetical protein [Nanoarchaeota archaeon]